MIPGRGEMRFVHIGDSHLGLSQFNRLADDGVIAAASVSRESGRDIMDRSVETAIRSVKRIEGVTPEFIRNHPTVTVGFAVTGE